jgi:RNA polymerase sigma factor (sigma-70 family)
VSRFGKQVATQIGGGEQTSPKRESKPDDLGQLVAAVCGGDPDAAATLIAHLGGSILKVVRKVLGRHDADVDDVAQDAVIAFLDALTKFRGECSVARFAQRIALLTALDSRRRTHLRARWSETQDYDVAPVGDQDPDSPLATTVASRRRALVLRLLDELPDVIAEALALHFVLGYTVEEIAAAAAVSPNTVWSRLRLGKQALRRRLKGDARLAEILADGGDVKVKR